jgi:glutathionyl-hydroquinone reductase
MHRVYTHVVARLLIRQPASIVLRSLVCGKTVRKICNGSLATHHISSMSTKAVDSLAELSATGAFARTDSVFRSWIRADGSTEFPAEAGRYLLYVSYACPWANRCLAVRALKGLESVVDVAVVSPVWDFTKPGVDEHRGWVFDPSFKDSTPDPLFGARTLRDVYEKLSGDMTVKKFTVPLLVDRKQGRIVNNESSEIIRMFNTEFNSLSSKPGSERVAAVYCDITASCYCYPSCRTGFVSGSLARRNR